MEDLLASFPEEFFPERRFQLIGRQQSLLGVGRFDLLFKDLRDRYWLLELKAIPLKITDTDQVMMYYDALHENHLGESFIPCFVAPSVPPHVRSYLDGKGIEYREFSIAEFVRVARDNHFALDLPADSVATPERRIPSMNTAALQYPTISGNWPLTVPMPTFNGLPLDAHTVTWVRISSALLLHTGKLTSAAHNACYEAYLGSGKRNPLPRHVTRYLISVCKLPVTYANGMAILNASRQPQESILKALGPIAEPLLALNA